MDTAITHPLVDLHDRFLAVWLDDDELVLAEFASIVAAGWPGEYRTRGTAGHGLRLGRPPRPAEATRGPCTDSAADHSRRAPVDRHGRERSPP